MFLHPQSFLKNKIVYERKIVWLQREETGNIIISIEVASRCVFCNKSFEFSSHLFIHFAWNLWMKFLTNGVLAVFSQNLLMICVTNGFLWWKAINKISYGSFSSPALCGIFGFIGMMSSLIGLLQTFKAVFLDLRQFLIMAETWYQFFRLCWRRCS